MLPATSAFDFYAIYEKIGHRLQTRRATQVKPTYVIVNPGANVRTAWSARKINRFGGYGPASLWMYIGIVVGFLPLLAALRMQGSVAYGLLALGITLHCVNFWLLARHLVFYVPHKRLETLVWTDDREIIKLDKAWTKFAQGNSSEDSRRFVTINDLLSDADEERRTRTVKQYLAALEAGISPYPAL